jgi:hypothetical protein
MLEDAKKITIDRTRFTLTHSCGIVCGCSWVNRAPPHQVSSCSELGWSGSLRNTESDKDSIHICAATKSAPLNECSGLMDFRTAR